MPSNAAQSHSLLQFCHSFGTILCIFVYINYIPNYGKHFLPHIYISINIYIYKYIYIYIYFEPYILSHTELLNAGISRTSCWMQWMQDSRHVVQVEPEALRPFAHWELSNTNLWYLSTCMYIYIYVYMPYIYIYIYTCHIYIYISHMYIYIYRICIYIYIAYVYIYYIYIYVYVYIYICIRQMPGLCPEPQRRRATHHHHHYYHHHHHHHQFNIP